MKTLNTLTLKQTLDLIEKNEISAADVVKDVQSEIERKNAELNIYLTLDKNAIKTAEAHTDQELKGIPIAVKDNFCTKGLRTTASSTVLDTFIPPYDSTVTKKLKTAGGTIIGKTNLDAWAHGSSTETSQFGRTLNPRNPDHLPGGSSGGSAAAVAADMCIAALGTETAGSIRQPAAWCGVVGLKPTYGRVSRYGIVAMASSTDSPGPIGKTVEDCSILLNVIAGQDPYDATTSPKPTINYTTSLDKSIKGKKIGIIYLDIPELKEIKSLYESQLKIFEQLGASIEYVKAMDPHPAIGVYTVVQRGEVSSNLARYDGIRFGNDRSHFGAEAKRRIMLGTYTLSKGYSDQYYNRAQQVRSLYIKDFAKLFETYDVLVAPTSPGYAKKMGATEGSSMFGELEDMLLEASSLAGLPAINVPCYKDDATGLFLGLNIIGAMFREDNVIQIADAFEKATKWNSWRNN